MRLRRLLDKDRVHGMFRSQHASTYIGNSLGRPEALVLKTSCLLGILVWCLLAGETLVFSQDLDTSSATAMARGTELYNQGKFTDAASEWTEAIRASRQKGDTRGEITAQILLAQAFQELGQYENAKIVLEGALEGSKTFDTPVLTAKILEGLGNIYFGMGKRKQGIKYFKEGLALSAKRERYIRFCRTIKIL